MMRALLAALPLAAQGYSLSSTTEVTANPIRRIVTLLQDMKKEIEADAEKEEELFKSFMCYCKTNDGQLSADAQIATETIATNNGAAEEKKGHKKQLEEELAQHKKDRTEAQQTLKQETERRAKEKAAYDEAAGETKTYIDGTAKAKKALERGRKGKMPRNPDDFLQTKEAQVLKNLVSVARIDSGDQQTMLNFLQGDYHSVGGEIIGILDNMLEEFKKSLGGIVEAEEAAIKSYLELKGAKESEIALATKSIEEKQETKGRLAVEIVQHEAAAATAAKEMEDAQEFLANLKQSCADKQADWDARSKARADELSAIQDAIDVLSDDDALDIFKSAVKKPEAEKASFLQIRRSKNVRTRAINLLNNLASKNPTISLMASTTAQKLKEGTSVDFSKIVIMIDDMIKLLKEEQTSDETTQTWCQDELRKNAAEDKETTTNIASLTSQIEALEAAIAEHNETIEKKNTEVAQLDKSVADATEQRKKENEEFNALIALNNSAVQLVEKAKNKLNRFYNPGQYKAPEERELTEEERLLQGAGQDIGDTTAETKIAGTEQTAFLQTRSEVDAPELPPAPETYGEHKNKGQKSNSVIALLSLMQNDLKKETQAAQHEEKTAQRDYETLVADAAKQRAECEQTVADSQGAIAEAEESRNAASTDKSSQETHLSELKQTNENLHKECDFILEHFEERREARTTEIDGLTTAKSVLSGADFN